MNKKKSTIYEDIDTFLNKQGFTAKNVRASSQMGQIATMKSIEIENQKSRNQISGTQSSLSQINQDAIKLVINNEDEMPQKPIQNKVNSYSRNNPGAQY